VATGFTFTLAAVYYPLPRAAPVASDELKTAACLYKLPPQMTEIVTTPIVPVVKQNWLNRLSPQAVFLLVVGFFGLAMGIVTPPVQVPDEPHHWYRIYQLTQGKFVSPHYGGDIPTSLLAYQSSKLYAAMSMNPLAKTSVQQTLNSLKEPLQPRKTRFADFPDCAIYPIVPYIPQTLAMLAARKLHWSALSLLYAGRLGTLVGYLLIGSTAIRLLPILKWPAVLILANPMLVFLSGSLSEDPVTDAMALLATALALRCILLPGQLSNRTIITLAVVMALVAVCKSAYLPIVLLVLAIPRDKWGVGSRKWWIPAVLIALSVGTCLAWSATIKAGDVRIHGCQGPAAQMQWMRHDPMKYLNIVRVSLVRFAPTLFDSAVGRLGWWDTPLNPGVIYLVYIVLAWTTLAYDEPIKLSFLPRFIAVIAVVCSAALVITACYLYACPTGDPLVEGLQGRYFLPVSLLICMVFRRRGSYTVQPKWMLAYLSLISLYTLWALIERFYLPHDYLMKLLGGTA
jgi:uncharacterized membrane protein